MNDKRLPLSQNQIDEVVRNGATKTELQAAVETLVRHLENDDGYRLSWVANIAVAFQDEMYKCSPVFHSHMDAIHQASNKAAESFLRNLCR